jgi:hypothetical protein
VLAERTHLRRAANHNQPSQTLVPSVGMAAPEALGQCLIRETFTVAGISRSRRSRVPRRFRDRVHGGRSARKRESNFDKMKETRIDQPTFELLFCQRQGKALRETDDAARLDAAKKQIGTGAIEVTREQRMRSRV